MFITQSFQTFRLHSIYLCYIFSFTEYLFTGGQQSNKAQIGSILPEGCLLAPQASRQADVCHQLHGDGQGDRSAPLLPPDEGPADQSCFAAFEKSYVAGLIATDPPVTGQRRELRGRHRHRPRERLL